MPEDKLEERIHALEVIVSQIQDVLIFYDFVDIKTPETIELPPVGRNE